MKITMKYSIVIMPPTHFFLYPPVIGSKSSSLKMKRDFSLQLLLKMTTRIKMANPAKVHNTNTIEAVLSIPSY